MSVFQTGRAWIELDRAALQQNIEVLRSKLSPKCMLMPAVKADAYGHGAVPVARELNKMGVEHFCVACVHEGVELRRQGIKGEILILGYTHPDQFELLCQYQLTQTVIDYFYALELDGYGQKIHVHIGIDTGMHRLGERSENIDHICGIFDRKNLVVDGMFTHLSADDTLDPKDQEFTRNQVRSFYEAAESLKARGYTCPKVHLQSSYGVLNYPDLTADYARVGIALYGVLSTGEDTRRWGDSLQPVLSLKARVAAVREVHPGETVGYGRQFAADRERRIATLAIGYADGLPRTLSNGGGAALIKGHRCPILGRICMDQTIIDVSSVPHVETGDVAVLIGRSGNKRILACDLAERAGTITNEILSRLGPRLDRIVVQAEAGGTRAGIANA